MRRSTTLSIRASYALGIGLTSKEIRASFLEYFRSNGHVLVPSAPIIPKNSKADFVFAGVQQFDHILNGSEQPSIRRVVNSQKCIRLGGDHITDLELVGIDTHHHTFFEMLGNWSFGDYYKEKACSLAWDYLTNIAGIDKRRLYVTFFGGDNDIGPDWETRDIWLRIGVPSSHIVAFGKKHNFWQAGPVGPCGPCSEIHIDRLNRNEDVSKLLNTDDPSLVELWNIVFMEYRRTTDGSLSSLPFKNVDTGMGFERLCSILQNCYSAYETDIFQPLLNRIRELTGNRHEYQGRTGVLDEENIDAAYRIVSDHMRSVVVALSDGIRFEASRKSARKIKDLFKRAMLYGNELGIKKLTMAELVPIIVDQLGDTYPEIREKQNRISNMIKKEEVRFWKQRDEGITHLEEMLRKLPKATSIFPGKLAFIIVQNYRIELDLVKRMVAQKGLLIDEDEYQNLYVQKTAGAGLKLKEIELKY